MCDVRDVAGAHIAAMTSPKAPGENWQYIYRKVVTQNVLKIEAKGL